MLQGRPTVFPWAPPEWRRDISQWIRHGMDPDEARRIIEEHVAIKERRRRSTT